VATEFFAVFADSFFVERASTPAGCFVLAAALLRVEFFVCPAFFLPAGAALLMAAEFLVDVFAALLFFSFERMETGLRAFVIAFDRS